MARGSRTIRPQAEAAPPTIRSDVQRNRNALLQAARELFAAGGEVPMYEVARRAGVGQATLYRHFPDRSDLAGAIAEELIEDLERLATTNLSRPEGFYVLLRGLVDTAARSGGLNEVLREGVGAASRLQHLRARLVAIFIAPLADAKNSGSVRSDFETNDILVVLAMIRGAVNDTLAEPGPRAAIAQRALDFLLDGVRRPATSQRARKGTPRPS